MELKGLCFDEIETIAQPNNEFPQLVDFMSTTGEYGPTKEPMRLAFVRMMCVDSTIWVTDEQWTSDKERYPPSAKQYLEFLEGKPSSRLIDQTIDTQKMNRRLFITSKGFIGLGSQTVEAGDKIYLLFGAEVPIMLRQDGAEFVLLGECYVHGLMNGEGLVAARSQADPNHDPIDIAWLARLHEETAPFKTEDVVIK